MDIWLLKSDNNIVFGYTRRIQDAILWVSLDPTSRRTEQIEDLTNKMNLDGHG